MRRIHTPGFDGMRLLSSHNLFRIPPRPLAGLTIATARLPFKIHQSRDEQQGKAKSRDVQKQNKKRTKKKNSLSFSWIIKSLGALHLISTELQRPPGQNSLTGTYENKENQKDGKSWDFAFT
jgi:hypothetical protein